MKILLTGASGFIGMHLIQDISEHQIIPISLRDTLPENLDLHEYDAVIHLAALVHQMSIVPEHDYLRINRDLTLSLAQKAKESGVSHFIFMSTVKVYGEETTLIPLNENSPVHPSEPYGKSKRQAEEGLLSMSSENFTVSIIRTPLVYGEGVRANMFNLIKLCDTLPILPFGGINNRRSIVYVKNLTAFIHTLLNDPQSEIFLVTDLFPVSTTQLIQNIQIALGKKGRLLPLPTWLINLIRQIKPSIHQRLFGSLEFDPSISFKKLNFIPLFSTKEGIENTVRWYQHD